jgi:hypothetical protein
VSENEEKYQAYIAYQSHRSNRYALFSGFTFTVIAILLTQLPDVTQVQAQIALFVLTAMLWVFLHELSGAEAAIFNCVRTAPPLPEAWKSKATALLENVNWVLLGLSVIILYLLWNLFYLALASATVAGILFIHAYIILGKPLTQRDKQWVRK